MQYFAFNVVRYFVFCLSLLLIITHNRVDATIYPVKNNTNICLLAQLKAEFNITYKTMDTKDAFSIIPNSNFTVDSSSNCSQLVLTWTPDKATKPWNLTFHFLSISTGDQITFTVDSMELAVLFENGVFNRTAISGVHTFQSNHSFFKAPQNSYYSCMDEQTINLLSAGESSIKADMKLSDVKLAAFIEQTKEEFINTEFKCAADVPVDNTVPIAVGVTLAVGILISLVLFFVFNQRHRRKYAI